MLRQKLLASNKLEKPLNSIWCSKRLLVAIVMLLSFTNIAMLMYNINIAVVEMTSSKTTIIGNATILFRPAEFDWDTVTVSVVSSIHSYGGIFAFLGGYFVDKFGGSVACAMSMMVCGTLTILHPAALHLNFNAFLVCRFVTGIFVNSFFVSTAEMYSRWFPKNERSTLIAIGYNGMNAGAALVYPIFGYVANEWGWRTVFYASGIVSVFISLICFVVVKNRPSEDEWISEAELFHILDGTDDASRKKVSHPHKKILSSAPVFAVCAGKIVLMWITTLLTVSLPSYVKDLTGKSTDQIGIISSIPVVGQIVVFPIAGIFLDAWKKSTSIEWTSIHKITIGFAFFTSSVLFLAAALSNNFTTSMILFVLVQIMMSVVPAVTEPITVSISPRDSSVIAAWGQIISCISIVVSRTCFGLITVNHSSQEWNTCFLLSSGVLICGVVIFTVFASSEAQPWSLSSAFEQEQDRLMGGKYYRTSANS